jgi:hypothetical protein
VADAGDAGVAVGRVTDQGQVVGDQGGEDAELGPHSFRVEDLLGLAIHLDYTVVVDALREVFVWGPDADLLHRLVARGEMGGGGEGVIRLELDHGPDGDSHGDECLFERMKLGEEGG